MNSPRIYAILKGIIKGLISHQSDVLDGPKISYNDKGTGYHNKHHLKYKILKIMNLNYL